MRHTSVITFLDPETNKAVNRLAKRLDIAKPQAVALLVEFALKQSDQEQSQPQPLFPNRLTA